jgi:CheY-like chemotaxis protein
VIDGHEVLNRLQYDPRTLGLPVVVITADATSRQKDCLLRAGAIDYLTKPLNIKMFLEVLDRALKGARQVR